MMSTFRKNLIARWVSVTATAAALAVTAAVAVPATADASPGSKGQPPEPTIGQFSTTLSRPVTDAAGQGIKIAEKEQLDEQILGTMTSGQSAQPLTATSANLAEPYFHQINEDYCGPATTIMVADYLGVGWSGSSTSQQDAAANLLATDSSGTAWYGADNVPIYPDSSWYPIQDLLNYQLYEHSEVMWYAVVALPGTPSSSDQSTFAAHLVTDITFAHPEADNQYSIVNYNLPYQPNEAWHHWWSARGYENNGLTTGINDPAAFADGVEHWVTTEGGEHTVVIALGGRGYIW